MHEGKGRLEEAGLVIGREDGVECEKRPGTVSTHTGARR